MIRPIALTLLLLAGAALSRAHFIFVVPSADGARATVFISETLEPDPQVGAGIVADTKLNLRDSAGGDQPLPLVGNGGVFEIALNGKGNRVVHGVKDFGVNTRGGKPHLLMYYPKSILGDAFDPTSMVGGDVPVEIVPTGKPGAIVLKLLAHGKPVADGEITVILPGGTQVKVKTDASGLSMPIPQTGRIGAWARYWESTPGERDGKKYEEVRNYATLVFDALPAAARLAALPEAASSMGAVESAGYLYVYGGHVAPMHNYFVEAVSGKFHRMKLSGEGKWESLPSGPALQGMNLAAYDGKIYRAGGMAPVNAQGEKVDNRSTDEAARFDPAAGKWEALPPLPVPRSSHDLVTVGSQLIVVGGWNLQGSKREWTDTLLLLDLSAKKLEWKSVPQPFRRRALIAASYRGKLYVIGGFDDKNKIVQNVSVFDPKTAEWSEAPKLPAGPGLTFAPAAAVHNGTLYVTVSDGTLLRLNESTHAWESAGASTGRVAHRMISHRGSVLSIGGAAGGNNLDLIESLPIAP